MHNYSHQPRQQREHLPVAQRFLLILIWGSLVGIVAASLFIAVQTYLGIVGPPPPPSPIISHGSPTPSLTPTTVPTPTPSPSPSPSPTLVPTPTPSPTPIRPTPTPSPPPPFPGSPLYSGNPQRAEIALTFDDGPSPTYTPQVLAILNRYGIHATFFVIGSQAAAYPDLVRQDYQQGNPVGNHSWSHPDLLQLAPAQVRSQLQTTSNAIQAATGVKPTLFRPPYGNTNSVIQSIASSLGLSTILWSVDPKDWSLPGTSVIVSRVLNSTHNGSIILLHEGGGDRSQTMAALPTIITTLKQRGFQFVTIAQMIQHLGKTGNGNAPQVPLPLAPDGQPGDFSSINGEPLSLQPAAQRPGA